MQLTARMHESMKVGAFPPRFELRYPGKCMKGRRQSVNKHEAQARKNEAATTACVLNFPTEHHLDASRGGGAGMTGALLSQVRLLWQVLA